MKAAHIQAKQQKTKQSQKRNQHDKNAQPKMHTNKIRQSSQSKTTKIKKGNKRDRFDTSLLNTTPILSDKYLSRPFQFVNEWEKQKGIQRHNKRHLANHLNRTQIRIFEIWKQKSDLRTTDQNYDTSTTKKE